MLGVGINDAGSDLSKAKAKRKKRDPIKGLTKDVSEGEWMGINIDLAMST